MRLFLAILVPGQTKRTLESAIGFWRAQSIRASWSKGENLHLTLEFLGEVQDPMTVVDVLNRVSCCRFSLEFAQCGRFSGRGGDILWLGIQPSPPLLALHTTLHRELDEAGFSLEHRPFRPHLTLARRLRHQEELLFPPPLPAPVSVQSFSLMRSELRSDGPRYTELFRKELMP